MEKTLAQAVRAKQELQSDILQLVKRYEETYGVCIANISKQDFQELGSKKKETCNIYIKVEL